MHWQYNSYVLPLVVATAVSAALALYVWRHRPAPGAEPFVLLMLAVAEWSLGYALELGCAGLWAKVLWAKVEYLGIAILPVAWLVFALHYAGRERWLTPRNLALVAIEPLAVLLLVWTNDIHGLIWSSVRLDASGSFAVLGLTYGAGFWVHVAYTYLSLLLGTLLLIRVFMRSPHLYRGQASAVLIGVSAPWVGNALYISGLNPFPSLDLTPFAFTLSGLAVVWGLFRFRLLDIVPVARDAVIESMGDAVVVLDAQSRIVDLNPAAQQVIGLAASQAIGQPAASVLPGRLDLLERYHDVTEAHSEVVLGEGEAQRTFDLRVSPLYDRRSHLTSRLVVLRDITRRKRAEMDLGVLYEAVAMMMTSVHLDEVLSHTLDALQETLQPDDIAILLVEPETNELVVRAHTGFPGGPKLMRRAIGVGIPGWVVQTGKPVLLADVREDKRYHGCDSDTLSELCVPLQVGERIIGAINLESRRLDVFSEEDLRLLSTLAGHLSTVIENARLFEEMEHLKVFNESIVQSVAEALFIEDADGIITFVNPAMEELLGYAADELVGQHWQIIVSPEEVERVQEKTPHHSDGVSERYETRLRAQDGRGIPVLVSARPLFEDGRFTGVLAAFTDITEREVLEGMWRRYEFIVNTSREFMALIGRNYAYEAVNELYCRAHNRTREEILGETVAEVWGEDVFDTIIKACLDECFAGDVTHYTEWFDFAALGRRCMDVTYYPYYNDAGIVTHAVVVSRDTTERQQAEEALQRRNRELTTLYEAATAISSYLSLDAVLQTVAEQMTQALDLSGCALLLWDRERSQVVTMVDYSVAWPDEIEAVCTIHDLSDCPAARRVLETRQPMVTRRDDPTADEAGLAWTERKKVRALLMLPLIARDRVLGLAELFTEAQDYTPEEIRLTQSLAAQAAIVIENVRLYEQAQQEITERRRAEGALCERTTQLESTNKELEAFAYSVSHDLRAPLRGIDGFSQILLEDYADRLDADGQDYLHRVRAASQRMAALIDDLLKLSRITRRGMHRETVDLSALAQKIAAELEQRKPDRQVEFVIAEGVVAGGDAGLLRVVLENLMSNAWKFTSKHPRARIEFGVVQHDGEAVYFVRDDGAGFDMAYADNMFGAFQRLHSATEFEGTGIGLATVQRIIHRHGGRVWAEGAVEQGATFYFTLQDLGGLLDLKLPKVDGLEK